MIEGKFGSDGKIAINDVHCRGTSTGLVADIGILVGNIYANLKKAPGNQAEMFKAAMQAVVLPDSPVWTLEPMGENYMLSVPVKRGQSDADD